MCEVNESIDRQRQLSADTNRTDDERQLSDLKARRLTAVHAHFAEGRLLIADMTAAERVLFGQFTSKTTARQFGLRFGLGAGEAASVAIALERGLTLATDDTDALKALQALSPRHPYERIRRMLMDAARTGMISREEANQVHDEIRSMNFWDTERPFPNV